MSNEGKKGYNNSWTKKEGRRDEGGIWPARQDKPPPPFPGPLLPNVAKNGDCCCLVEERKEKNEICVRDLNKQNYHVWVLMKWLVQFWLHSYS